MKPRSSCDACHLRKTKCNLLEEIQKRRDEEVVSCSFCSSLGVPCRVTSGALSSSSTSSSKHATGRGDEQRKGIIKHKKGKRIRELLANAAHEVEEGGPQDKKRIPSLVESMGPATSSSTSKAAMMTSSTSLLGVEGFSIVELEACLDGFFSGVGIWMSLSQGREIFLKRVHLFLQNAGIRRMEHGKSEDEKVQPISDILLLAVAYRGASFSRFAHLEGLILHRVSELAQIPGYLEGLGLDGLEAIVMLSERNVGPVHATPPGGRGLVSTALDPLSKGFAAEFCLFMKLNEEPPVYSTDYIRRTHLFWSVYCYDALRSVQGCRMYRIHDEDIGWSSQDTARLNPIVTLAQMARRICSTVHSPRARSSILQVDDIMTLLDDLAHWPESVGVPIDLFASPYKSTPPSTSSSYSPGRSFPYSTTAAAEPKSTHSSISLDLGQKEEQEIGNSPLEQIAQAQRREHQRRIQQSAMIGPWLRCSLSIWTSLHEVGFLSSSEIMVRVEEETAQAAVRMAKLCQFCIDYHLVDFSPNALLTSAAAWLLYLARKLSQLRGEAAQSSSLLARSSTGVQKSSAARSLEEARCETKRIWDMAEVLLRTIQSAKTRPEARELSQRLEGVLHRATPAEFRDSSRLMYSAAPSEQQQQQSIDENIGFSPADRHQHMKHMKEKKQGALSAQQVSPLAHADLAVSSSSSIASSSSPHVFQQGSSSALSEYVVPERTRTGMTGAGQPDHQMPQNGSLVGQAHQYREENGAELLWDDDFSHFMTSIGLDMPDRAGEL